MDVQNYVRFNELLDVRAVKVDTNTSKSMQEAIDDFDQVSSSTSLLSIFTDNDGVDAIYFDQSEENEDVLDITTTVYRKTPNQPYYDFVCEADNQVELFDYNVLSNQFYHYLVVLAIHNSSETVYRMLENTETEFGTSSDNIVPIYYKNDFDNWYICDIEETDQENIYQKIGKTWKLGLAIEAGTNNQNLSITTWDTLGKYGKASVGQKNYDSGTWSGLLGEMKEINGFNIPVHSAYPVKTVSVLPENGPDQSDSINTHYILIRPYICLNADGQGFPTAYNVGAYV